VVKKDRKKRAAFDRGAARAVSDGPRTAQRGLEWVADHWVGSFEAMASRCELLLDLDATEKPLAARLLAIASEEAGRIERKFSRYSTDSVLGRIHAAHGQPVTVDEETAALLDFAGQCFEISEGRFDVTSGVLRRVWRFDGSDRVPAPSEVAAIRPLVGWGKVEWRRPELRLPEGMEVDFGGIGKEYAVDRVIDRIAAATAAPLLVNFGGDLRARGPRRSGAAWHVGVEDPRRDGAAVREIELFEGALATSGDARRFLEKGGVRYPHILDPRTGWPVLDAPRSVTVAAPTCTEAGMLATFAMLRGPEAESFLEEQGVRFWCTR
jgi:thiamine biosynthesis lipoprotein